MNSWNNNGDNINSVIIIDIVYKSINKDVSLYLILFLEMLL